MQLKTATNRQLAGAPLIALPQAMVNVDALDAVP